MDDVLTPQSITKKALKLAKKAFIIKLLVSFTSRCLLMIIPILFSFAVDNISKGNYEQAFFMATVSIFVFMIFRTVDVINTYTWHKLYNKLYNSYTSIGLQNTHDNSLFSLSRISIGEYINIMNNDVNVMCEFYCNLPTRIIRVVEFFIIFIYFFIINVFIGLAGIIVSLIVFSILYISSKRIQTLNQKRALELDRKSGVLHEILLCIKDIKGFNIFEPIKSRTIKASDNYVEALLKQRVVEDVYKFGIVLLIEIFRLCLFMYGIYLISQGKMELGVLLVIYNYYAQLIDNFSDFATINVNFRNLKVSEGRFNKILEYSNQTKQKNSTTSDYQGEITFNNILYGYKDNPTLNNVSFHIKPGTITGIVGDAGSGKTGISDLLLKLNRPHTGEILIDSTNINDFNHEDYYDLVASVGHDTTFFNVSIKDNLKIIEDDFEQIIDICKQLDIHEYIIRLKDGYDTILTANGSNVDVNIKQLLGIARVLTRDAKIMLFDEVTGNLNSRENENLLRMLQTIKPNHTIIIFSKDTSVLEQSDNIIFMENNKISDINTHRMLLEHNQRYKEMVTK